MRKVNIAVIGFGTVGGGVVSILQKNRELIKNRAGVDINIKYVVSRNFIDKEVEILYAQKVKDYNIAIEDKEIDVIVELVGGIETPYDIITKSLSSGKCVVTANKALLAEKGYELFELAKSKNLTIGYEASVGGGIPIIRVLSDALVGDRITEIFGILNGTTNFILTKMYEEGKEFSDALREAQELGFAEADPSLDIDGIDTAHKIFILSQMAFNARLKFEEVYIEGIRNISQKDIVYAKELGFVIKLLGISKIDEEGNIDLRVHPSLVPFTNQLAHVGNEFNAILVNSENLSKTMYYGRGAGRYPTAVSVVADIVEVAKNLSSPQYISKMKILREKFMKPIGDVITRYYLRFSVIDKPGVLAAISKILGDNNISIASVIQKEVSPQEFVPLVMITHEAKEKDMIKALSEISNLKVVKGQPVMIRIIDDN